MAAQRLLAWPKQATVAARSIVLEAIKSHDAPISTRELFEKAVKVPVTPGASAEPLTPWARHLRNANPAPPHPEHPIRSLNYLKRTVLENLVHTRDVKKVHIKRVLSPAEIEQRKASMSKAQLKKTSVAALSQPVSMWMWQLVDKSQQRQHGPAKVEGWRRPFGSEVGAGEEWGHLNRRRRRARVEKVGRDVKWMRELQKARDADESRARTGTVSAVEVE